MLTTKHIVYFPHREYNIKTELTDNLRIKDYIQYGYIKRRDLLKWENNEECAVKMGMLTPSNKIYRGLSIVESALKRIKEQDSTALFDDEDELIPIYIFVSNETDNEWRDYLKSLNFKSSRQNVSREGIRIRKKDINLLYGKHYGYDTEEVLSEKEIIENEVSKECYVEHRKDEIYQTVDNIQMKEHRKEYLWVIVGILFVILSMTSPLWFNIPKTKAEKERSEFVADSIRQERQKTYELAVEKIKTQKY